MSNFIVRVELKGSQFDGDEYARLHRLMGSEGFWPCIAPAGAHRKFQPPPPPPISSALPHATYFGASGLAASALLDLLVIRIANEIQPEVVVVVAETMSYAVHPK